MKKESLLRNRVKSLKMTLSNKVELDRVMGWLRTIGDPFFFLLPLGISGGICGVTP